MNKKKVVIIVIGVILAICLIVGGVFLVKQNNEKKQREAYWESLIVKLQKYDTDFNEVKNDDDKLEVIDSIKTDIKSISDKDSKNYSKDIEDKYNEFYSEKCDYFKKAYDDELKNNTIDDVENCVDKEALNTAKDNLTKLSEKLEDGKGIVLTEAELKEYNENIDTLKTSYETRVAAIEEEERLAAEEAARKAEEERLAAEEAARKEAEALAAKNNASSNNTASNNGDSSNSGSCGPTAPGIPYFATEEEKWAWMESLTYETVPYYDGIRTFYDESGNMVGREKVWGNAHYPEGYSEMYWGGDWEDCLSEKS